MNKQVLSIIGFLMFIIGSVAIVLTLVGLRLKFLAPIEELGAGYAFLIKIIIALFGLIIIYLVRTATEE